jgi:Flp pilus assembly protein TadG
MPMKSIARSGLARFDAPAGLARFRRDEKGATAVEFGLLAVPFVALLFAVLETALMFFASQALETAVANSSRLIRTGQAQQQNMTIDQFRSDICAQIMSLFACSANLQIEVRTYTTFDTVDLSKPVDANGNLKTNFTFALGHGGDIVVVRAFYEWPVWSTLLGINYANMTDGAHLLISASAFKNEPFPW